MDSLSSAFETVLQEESNLEPQKNGDVKSSGDAKPAFADLYKFKKSNNSQEERRKTLLEEQKKRRNNLINEVRHISYSSDSDNEDEDEDDMDCTEQASARIRPRFYKNKLMLSEWLLEIPDDLKENWVTLICPIGKRNLIVSARGKTTAYTKSGFRLSSFPSLLPGGNRNFHTSSSDYCILDCIFSAEEKTYYILDVLCWKGHSVVDSDTDFRFYWLHDKLSESGGEVQQVSRLNPYRFVPLHYHKYGDLELVLSKPPMYKVDGLLFYHRGTHYIAGRTPLVGWLKPYMVSEHLNIPVCDFYINTKPDGYVNMRTELIEEYQKLESGMVGIEN